ncbi:MAG TPA: biotin--[acetyl-CoA-carboxylase] ligase [Vicinamibacterales bacterium]|nr:biotin--[acetyl-CoA-carboxylase] ligase [Vicinamibacterales bacterium]
MSTEIRWYDSVPSTMDVAASLVAEGAPHGVVVAAREQTAGRGRRGATWESPPGAGLYFSFIARPTDQQVSLVTLAAGLGVRDGVAAATGLAPVLKWPNDLLVGRRKLAGILAEGHAIGSPEQAIVIGVGVNVLRAAYPPDVAARATSLEDELGRSVDRDTLLNEIVVALGNRVVALSDDPGDILRSWRASSPSALGTRVEWDGRHGVTAGIDDSGALLVNTSAGVERIIAGHLHWNL